jgi:hypothetical protein
VDVEWLSVGTTDRTDIDVEARWIGVTATLRRGGLERRQCRGTTGQSCGSDTEVRLVGVIATMRRCGRSQAGGDLEVRSVWTPAAVSGDPLPFRSRTRARMGLVIRVQSVGHLVRSPCVW